MPQRGRRTTDDVLLAALACGATWEAAAQKAGVSKATVQRRLKNPEFCQRLQDIGTDTVKRATATLTTCMTEAIKTLLMLTATSIPHAVRLGAARSILDIAVKLREVTDLEERLAALEERSPSNKPRGR
jgi:hypothetical protein